MVERLQVLLAEPEWRALQRAARAERTTVAQWVRHAIRQARLSTSSKDVDRKLEAVRTGAGHAFPTADIDQMNAEPHAGQAFPEPSLSRRPGKPGDPLETRTPKKGSPSALADTP